jgi:hypothetical protein
MCGDCFLWDREEQDFTIVFVSRVKALEEVIVSPQFTSGGQEPLA